MNQVEGGFAASGTYSYNTSNKKKKYVKYVLYTCMAKFYYKPSVLGLSCNIKTHILTLY